MVETMETSCDRGDADFLADGDGADGRAIPAIGGTQQTAGFAGQLHAGALAKAEGAYVLIEAILAHLESELDGGHVAGSRESRGYVKRRACRDRSCRHESRDPRG